MIVKLYNELSDNDKSIVDQCEPFGTYSIIDYMLVFWEDIYDKINAQSVNTILQYKEYTLITFGPKVSQELQIKMKKRFDQYLNLKAFW